MFAFFVVLVFLTTELISQLENKRRILCLCSDSGRDVYSTEVSTVTGYHLPSRPVSSLSVSESLNVGCSEEAAVLKGFIITSSLLSTMMDEAFGKPSSAPIKTPHLSAEKNVQIAPLMLLLWIAASPV